MQRIIADCHAALSPPNVLWQQYENELRRLQESGKVTENQYNLLRYSVASRNALMDLTLGDVDVFTEGTVEEVLARAEASAREDVERQVAEVSQERDAAKLRAITAEQRAEALVESHEGKERARRERVRSRSTSVGRILARPIQMLIVTLVVAAAFFSVYIPPVPGGLIAPLIAGIGAPVAILSLCNLVAGTTVNRLTQDIEVRIANATESFLTKWSN